jgi:hypothetical protein
LSVPAIYRNLLNREPLKVHEKGGFMDNAQSLCHTKWDCKYHVVWIPKCRRKVLYGRIAERLDVLVPLTELIKRVAAFVRVEPKELCQRGRKTLVADTKSIICFLAARRIGYSGEAVAKALGITRSGVCRGASRGAALIEENPAKWGELEGLIN